MPRLYGKMPAFDIDLFKNKQRIRSTRGGRTDSIPIENNTWVQAIPKTKHLSAYEPTSKTYIPTPRRIALERKLEEIVAQDKRAFWDSNIRFKIGERLYCYVFRGQFGFVEFDERGNNIRYSNLYKSRGIAMDKYRRGKIYWAGNF
jgi:hypothetical protein